MKSLDELKSKVSCATHDGEELGLCLHDLGTRPDVSYEVKTFGYDEFYVIDLRLDEMGNKCDPVQEYGQYGVTQEFADWFLQEQRQIIETTNLMHPPSPSPSFELK